MNTVVTHSNLVFREKKSRDIINKPSGFLTSNYKQLVIENYNQPNIESLFTKRQLVKATLLNHTVGIETILKLTLFLGVLSFIL